MLNIFLARLVGASLLKSSTYEQIEADRAATGQAAAVVLLSSLAAGVGAAGATGESGRLAAVSLIALAAWAAWALLTLQIGTRIFPAPTTQADFGQLLRTIGFASAPGILRVAGVVPGATTAVFAITAVWMLAAMIVAVRQALDYSSTRRAFAVCALGWTLVVALILGIGGFFAPPVY